MIELLFFKTIFGVLAGGSVYLAIKFEVQKRNLAVGILFGVVAVASFTAYHYVTPSNPVEITISGITLMAFALYVQHIFKRKPK